MERKAQAAEPPTPEALLQPIVWNGESHSPRFRRGWCSDEIARLAPPNAKELLALKLAYDKAIDEVWTEADAGQERYDEIVSDNTDIINEIAETPANTLQGLLAKCHMSQVEGLFEWHSSFNEMAQSILEDVQRLAPQMIGRA